jgi:hypothetical protein
MVQDDLDLAAGTRAGRACCVIKSDSNRCADMIMRSSAVRIVWFLLGASVSGLPALAAGGEQPGGDQSQKCAPGARPPGGEGAGKDLSRKLDDCNGVLSPPGVGDGDMVEPAPDTGTGRVIEPNDLPPQGNPSNGSGG